MKLTVKYHPDASCHTNYEVGMLKYDNEQKYWTVLAYTNNIKIAREKTDSMFFNHVLETSKTFMQYMISLVHDKKPDEIKWTSVLPQNIHVETVMV